MNKNEKIPSTNAPGGDCFDTQDMLNKYGTYNIQPTADTENLFPQISAGLPKRKKSKGKDKKSGLLS